MAFYLLNSYIDDAYCGNAENFYFVASARYSLQTIVGGIIFIVGVIELFNYTVSPRFCNWNKNRLNSKM